MANAGMSRSSKDDKVNLYTTPPWATEVFAEKEPLPKRLWECCCGMGHISEVLLERGHEVSSTDLYDHGYGEPGIDFLKFEDPDIDCVITNPPFDKEGTHMKMLKHALAMPNIKKVCFFLPMQFLETPDRADWLENCEHFSKVYSFASRVKCLTKGEESLSRNNTAKHFAWFVFDKSHDGSPATVHFLHKPKTARKAKGKK